ncbi:MAG TPA: ABC transporter permease [Candidatus Lustribacter sp.]|jgi:NitT/TauT family transport system permease protein|nr:ABC transporter permease [Candidatus Lustribacter sp.]
MSAAAIRWWTIAALLVLWEVAARLFGDPAFVAPPSAVLRALVPTVFGDPKLTAALGMALLEIVTAFVLAVIAGATVGIAIGITTLGRRSLFPFVLLLFGLPQVTVLPLVILIFGLGPASRIAFGFTHGVLPIIVTTVSGMRAVSPLLLSSARSMGASQAQVLRHIIFPTMVASVFTGLRLAMSLTLLGVILAELFVSSNGIGNYTQIFAETFKPASLYSVILVLALTAVVLNELVALVEKHFSRWKQG